MGAEALNARFGIQKPMQCLLGKTSHYSWGKGGGILGIGSNNVVGIDVDLKGRVDLHLLDKHLMDRLDKKQAIVAVVAIIGTTEVGAVDDLTGILTLRQRYQERGLSFLVLADAAWGGYFTTMLPRDDKNRPITSCRAAQLDRPKGDIPHAMQLSTHTESALASLRFADSITVDPHKAGYVPYPAGGVVYRDMRMAKLVSCKGPYLAQASNGSMGVNGLGGSKPGAAAMSIWLSNYCIGLNPSGYGALLAEVSFNSAKMSAHWATLTDSNDSFICVPFDEPPIDKESIRRSIVHRSYEDTGKVPFYLTSTEFSVDRYGKSLAAYKERLGLGSPKSV